jgi:predicted lipoprotein with Yx(FWY)xxD motif
MMICSGIAVLQWAYKGTPLYLWSKVHKPGDMTGDGFNGLWHVVKD